jgi:hypothetical protein
MSRTCGRSEILMITPSDVEKAIVGVCPRLVKHPVASLSRFSLSYALPSLILVRDSGPYDLSASPKLGKLSWRATYP